ncbi:MAG TPA: FAD-dependent oxidoreductase [Gemmataceae bacterium]|jgi:cation diffusion facilitator CzcD-associated flavoprotein CzcO|nr:FAD-dependent oxidoreductase [Gemmataceae bacterium]
MPKTDVPRIAVLGAGPVGLEAALYARSLKLPVTVYERGRVGEHLHRWGHVRLFTPFGMNSTPLGRAAIRDEVRGHEFPADSLCTTGREHLAAYLEPLAKNALLRDCLRTDTQVLHVGRRGLLKDDLVGDARRAQQPFRLVVRQGKNRETVEQADVVLDCTGTFGQHRWMGDGGIPAVGEAAAEPQVPYGLEDVLGDRRGAYAGKNILVVGGGYSAATTVCNLAALAEHHPETWVVWLARVPSTQPIKRFAGDPLRERDRLAVRANTLATRGDGNVEFHNQAVIDVIDFHGPDKGFRVGARCGGKPQTWDVDRLLANVGYSPDTALYRELQVHECYASLGPMTLAAALMKHGSPDGLPVPAQGANALRNPEPNFYILGAKSYGRNTNFLLRTGFDQVREVFTLIAGKPDLDLYKKR